MLPEAHSSRTEQGFPRRDMIAARIRCNASCEGLKLVAQLIVSKVKIDSIPKQPDIAVGLSRIVEGESYVLMDVGKHVRDCT